MEHVLGFLWNLELSIGAALALAACGSAVARFRARGSWTASEPPAVVVAASFGGIILGALIIPGIVLMSLCVKEASLEFQGQAPETTNFQAFVSFCFAASSAMLAGFAFLLGIHILKFGPNGGKYGVVFALWAAIHHALIVALILAVPVASRRTLVGPIVFEMLNLRAPGGTLIFIYSLLSLFHASIVWAAIDAHKDFSEAHPSSTGT